MNATKLKRRYILSIINQCVAESNLTKEKLPREVDEIWSDNVISRFDASQTAFNFIYKSIYELLDADFQTIQDCKYSSDGMNELQNLFYLIEQTDKILFPSGEQYIKSIIYDELSKNGRSRKSVVDSNDIGNIVRTIKKFANWHDTANRFNYKPSVVFSSKFFEVLQQERYGSYDKRILANFLIFYAERSFHARGQEIIEEVKKQCEEVGYPTCIEILRDYIDLQDSDGVY